MARGLVLVLLLCFLSLIAQGWLANAEVASGEVLDVEGWGEENVPSTAQDSSSVPSASGVIKPRSSQRRRRAALAQSRAAAAKAKNRDESNTIPWGTNDEWDLLDDALVATDGTKTSTKYYARRRRDSTRRRRSCSTTTRCSVNKESTLCSTTPAPTPSLSPVPAPTPEPNLYYQCPCNAGLCCDFSNPDCQYTSGDSGCSTGWKCGKDLPLWAVVLILSIVFSILGFYCCLCCCFCYKRRQYNHQGRYWGWWNQPMNTAPAASPYVYGAQQAPMQGQTVPPPSPYNSNVQYGQPVTAQPVYGQPAPQGQGGYADAGAYGQTQQMYGQPPGPYGQQPQQQSPYPMQQAPTYGEAAPGYSSAPPAYSDAPNQYENVNKA